MPGIAGAGLENQGPRSLPRAWDAKPGMAWLVSFLKKIWLFSFKTFQNQRVLVAVVVSLSFFLFFFRALAGYLFPSLGPSWGEAFGLTRIL